MVTNLVKESRHLRRRPESRSALLAPPQLAIFSPPIPHARHARRPECSTKINSRTLVAAPCSRATWHRAVRQPGTGYATL